MKLRIKGDTLRLRLTKSEVDNINGDGHVSDSIDFGERKLIYALQADNIPNIKADYSGDIITVSVPGHMLRTWATTDETGISGRQHNDDGTMLDLLIEKDFQCLKERSGEDETDMFKNPLA